uniref:Uncharacterized protein n=1 Tax=Anguilla anguilla TaxID=7936 RepID=A0A0E9XNG9_ANGAN
MVHLAKAAVSSECCSRVSLYPLYPLPQLASVLPVPGTQFKVSAYYRGVKVLEQLVENNAGFKVLFR